MPKIDAHQHFWKFDPVRDNWITSEMAVIRKDFLPADLKPILEENGFDGCVTIQSEQSEQENDFQLGNADKYDFIKGVVGWVDLIKEDISDRLEYYRKFKKLKGFRHILQSEQKRDFMLQPEFIRGIHALKKFNYTYDILIFTDQMKFVSDFVAQFPDQKFVIDHLAKPGIKHKEIDEWKSDLAQIAQFENVHCKISGYITEADLQHWKKEDFAPYLDTVFEAFGSKRVVFGSDWPVCLLGSDYKTVVNITNEYFSSFSENERDDRNSLSTSITALN